MLLVVSVVCAHATIQAPSAYRAANKPPIPHDHPHRRHPFKFSYHSSARSHRRLSCRGLVPADRRAMSNAVFILSNHGRRYDLCMCNLCGALRLARHGDHHHHAPCIMWRCSGRSAWQRDREPRGIASRAKPMRYRTATHEPGGGTF